MIRDALLIQKRELDKALKDRYVERLNAKGFVEGVANVIIGPRRSGKSYFAIHTLSKAGSFGYVNFDDERLVEVQDYNEIVDALNSLYNKPKYLLLDEVQNLDRWELFVNRLQRQGYNMVITGSNSKLLSKELATHLTGRHFLINIFPFSFKEFLKLGPEKGELTESEIKTKLFFYLTNGGYPEPFIKGLDYKDYLLTLLNSIVYKDIVKRYKIRSVEGIDDLATYLISNIAHEYSYNTLAKVTKCKSSHTVEKYLNYLEEAFIFFRIKRFSYKVKEQTGRKIYCIDNGFINAKTFKISPDTGKLYENIVAIELKKMEMNGSANVYYWKSKQQEEVDFIIKKDLQVKELIQVCYNVKEPKTKEREIRALVKAGKELRCKNLLVITENYEGEEKASWFGMMGKVRFMPLWRWLLSHI